MSPSTPQNNKNSTSIQDMKANGFQSQLQSKLKFFDKSWLPFFALSIVFSLGTAIALNLITALPQLLILGVVIGLFLALIIFQNPEIGGYLLIFTVFTNMSDLFTEKGLPSINKPLMAVTILSILVHYLFKTEKRLQFPQLTRIELSLLAYFTAIFASSFVASDRSLALSSFFDLMKDVAVGLCIFITLNTKSRLKTGVNALIFGVVFVSLLGVFKTFTGTDQTFWGFAQNSVFGQVNSAGVLRFGGPIGESNVWAQVLAATLPFVIYQLFKRPEPLIKITMLGSALVIFLCLLYTESRGAIVALFLVLPLIILEMRLNLTSILIFAVVSILVISLVPSKYTERIRTLQIFFQTNQEYGLTQDESVAGRREKMLTGLAMFKDKPFLGVGFGNYNTNYWKYAGQLGFEAGTTDIQSAQADREPHSLYIEIMSETGLFGIITFLAFFWFLFGGLYQARKRALDSQDKNWSIWITSTSIAILSFLISGFFLHGIRFRYIWMLIGLALAAIYITKRATSPNSFEEVLD